VTLFVTPAFTPALLPATHFVILLRVVTSRCAAVNLRFVKGLKKLDTLGESIQSIRCGFGFKLRIQAPLHLTVEMINIAMMAIAMTTKMYRTSVYRGSTKTILVTCDVTRFVKNISVYLIVILRCWFVFSLL
jgi:hypothetical protein